MIFCNNQSEYDTSTILANGTVCSASGCDCDDGILSDMFMTDLYDPRCRVQTSFPSQDVSDAPSTAPAYTTAPSWRITDSVNITETNKDLSNDGDNDDHTLSYVLVAIAAVVVTAAVIGFGYYL